MYINVPVYVRTKISCLKVEIPSRIIKRTSTPMLERVGDMHQFILDAVDDKWVWRGWKDLGFDEEQPFAFEPYDEATYTIYDEFGDIIASRSGYVPDCLMPAWEDAHCICLRMQPDGSINKPIDTKKIAEYFFDHDYRAEALILREELGRIQSLRVS